MRVRHVQRHRIRSHTDTAPAPNLPSTALWYFPPEQRTPTRPHSAVGILPRLFRQPVRVPPRIIPRHMDYRTPSTSPPVVARFMPCTSALPHARIPFIERDFVHPDRERIANSHLVLVIAHAPCEAPGGTTTISGHTAQSRKTSPTSCAAAGATEIAVAINHGRNAATRPCPNPQKRRARESNSSLLKPSFPAAPMHDATVSETPRVHASNRNAHDTAKLGRETGGAVTGLSLQRETRDTFLWPRLKRRGYTPHGVCLVHRPTSRHGKHGQNNLHRTTNCRR